MSWDATLNVQGHDVFEVNYTHNMNSAIRAAGFESWWSGVGRMGSRDMAYRLTQVLIELRARPLKYIEMEPANGWGSVKTLVPVIQSMVEACREHPAGTWEVHG